MNENNDQQPPAEEQPAAGQVSITRMIAANYLYEVKPLPAAANGGEPGKLLIFVDRNTGHTHEYPMNDSAATDLAAKLTQSDLTVARVMPDLPEVPGA